MPRSMSRRGRRAVASLGLVVVALAGTSSAIVTSDGPGTHIVGPGTTLFGVDHLGVGRMFIMFPGDPEPGICTCTLLARGGGRYAITAAHCLSDGTSVIPDFVTVRWITPGGVVLATATKAAGQIHIHPAYDGDVLHGYDVAILEFSDPVDLAVTRYDIYDPAIDATPLLDSPGFKVGYGTTGFGATGDTGPFGTKRIGMNSWQSFGLGALGVTAPSGFMANPTQLTFDFDSPGGVNDAFGFFFPGLADAGFGGDEVMVAVGDSGGPTFLATGGGHKIAGVASYRTRVIRMMGGTLVAETPGMPFPASPDVDAIINSSWGEFGADANLSHADIVAFIDSIIPPCLADLSGSADPNDAAYGMPDGLVDASDFFFYLDKFVAGDLAVADLTGSADPNDPAYGMPDGMIDASDFFFYLDAFVAGCP
jgi:hypothetical protein